MQKIVFTRPDGGLTVIHPILNTVGEVDGFTEADALARAWKDVPSDAIAALAVDDAALPVDRSFRDAWTHQGGGVIVHDMERARAIHKNRLRAARVPLLAALDVQYIKADEAGDIAAKQSVAARKQALRDVTADPRIAAAATIDELKAAIPAALR